MSALARIRKKRGMTQDSLARLVGVNPVTVSQWERGAWFPATKHLRAIAKVLGCKVADLMADV